MDRKINAVIFDQDGLMFDTERVSSEAWKITGDEFGFHVEESFLCTIRGAGEQDVIEKGRRAFGDEVDFPAFRRRKREIFAKLLEERGVPVKPGLKELLSYLRENGYKTAVATASQRERTLMNLREAGIEECFDYMITGDMVTRAKPDPELFLTAAKMLGETPEHCIVLEDSLNGVEAGLRGGFVTIMVPDLTQPDEELRRRLNRVCGSLCEVKELLMHREL